MLVNKSQQVLEDLKLIFSQLKEKEINEFKDLIYKSERLFFAAAGRSKLMLKAVAMRFMQYGFEIYLVGETNTPAFRENDLLIVASGSGETKSTILFAENAKNIGGRIALITASKNSTLAKISDQIVEIPVNRVISEKEKLLPGGSYFEEALLILGDNLIISIVEQREIKNDKLYQRHANLE
jgi:6-phospho-3-hexuloisomerase